MSEFRVMRYSEEKLRDPIAIVGFPSVGLVGSIVSSYLTRDLKLPVVAGVSSADLPPYTLIQNGTAYPPIRIYAGAVPKPKRKRKPKAESAPASETSAERTALPEGGDAPKTSEEEGKSVEGAAENTVEAKPKRVKARDLVVVTSEIAPKPEQTYDLTMCILDTLEQMGVREIVCIDGIPRVDSSQEGEMLGTATSENAIKKLEETGVPVMKEGLVRGVTGIMLYEGTFSKKDIICILCPANPQLPDPRAAATALTPLSKIVPNLNIDPTPLNNEANDIDNRVRAQQQAQQEIGTQNIYG